MKSLILIAVSLLMFTNVIGQTFILTGENASEVEINAANDLYADLVKVYPSEKVVIKKNSDKLKCSDYRNLIVIGKKNSSEEIASFLNDYKELKPETFVLKSQTDKKGHNVLYIAGADDRGLFYGVYQFSQDVLGIDPCEYWTDCKPAVKENFSIPHISYEESAPIFPLRGYFDNDNDMLANWKGRKLIVELDTWKEMINSLARMRYNYIDIHDLLGRTEYYYRDFYKNLTEYHTDLELVDQVIDYAHSKGMLVQIPIYLGWEFHHIDLDKICLSENMEHWMDVYDYYLNESPIGKGDLFLQRPRHPYYDHAYFCQEEAEAGIKPGPLMTTMFNRLYEKIKKRNPDALLFCDLWSEGRIMWKKGEFKPNKEIQFLWADYGESNFRDWPEDHRGHPFGIYIHAGVWQNHVMQDPYPGLIQKAVVEANQRQMNNNILVNGQDFKHFILNLEACAKAAWSPDTFDSEQFYLDWTSRYFGEKAAPVVVESLKELHTAHLPAGGFRRIMAWKTVKTLNLLQKGKVLKVDDYAIKRAHDFANEAYLMAEKNKEKIKAKDLNVYNDQILFPAKIFMENVQLAEAVIVFNNTVYKLKNEPFKVGRDDLDEVGMDMLNKLITLRKSLDSGSGWDKWEGWTKCKNFRMHTPPPTIEEVESVLSKFN